MERLFPELHWTETLKDVAWMLLLAPIWLPNMLIDTIRLRRATHPLVVGRVDVAWERCTEVWRRVGLVCQDTHHYRVPFEHLLAVALARQHYRAKEFFRGKLLDPNPLLAAYAFKCLVRVCELHEEDMPPEAFARPEPIRVFRRRHVDEETIGDFFRGYFVQKQLGLPGTLGPWANWWRHLIR